MHTTNNLEMLSEVKEQNNKHIHVANKTASVQVCNTKYVYSYTYTCIYNYNYYIMHMIKAINEVRGSNMQFTCIENKYICCT